MGADQKLIGLSDVVSTTSDFRINQSIGVYAVYDFTSYKHRIGRTGRYQSSGLVVNLIEGPVEQFMYEYFHEKLKQSREDFLANEVRLGMKTEIEKQDYLAANPKIIKTIDDLIAMTALTL